MIPVLAIPHLNRPDLLLRLLRSVDYPVGDLVLIQNGKDKDCEIENVQRQLQQIPHGRFHHWRFPNLGVSGSWNLTMIALPGAPYWMFVGNDVEFCPGTMAKFDMAAREHHLTHAIFFGNLGHSMFVQTRRGTKNLGLYSWELHPAYCEDCEIMWRLSRTPEKVFQVPDANGVHGEPGLTGSCTIGSDNNLREQNHRTHGNNFELYRQKTGGMPGQERFDTPFNLGYPVNLLGYDPELRARNTWTI